MSVLLRLGELGPTDELVDVLTFKTAKMAPSFSTVPMVLVIGYARTDRAELPRSIVAV